MGAEGSGTERAPQGSRKRSRPVEDELIPGARSCGVGAGGIEREWRERLAILTSNLSPKEVSRLLKCTNRRVSDGDEQNEPPIRDERVVFDAAAVDKATREGFSCSGVVVGTVVHVLSWKGRTGGVKEDLDCFLSKGLQAPGVRGLPA